MSFILAVEALKFYKLKQERLVQLLFLLCFALNATSILFPVGDTDFHNLQAWVSRSLELDNTTSSNLISYAPALSGGNLLFLASQAVLLLLNLLFSYFYAAAYSAERDGLPAIKGIKSMFRSLPKLLLYVLLLIVPAFFSLFFLLVPLIIGSLVLLFVPLFIAERKIKLSSAISYSYLLTKHRKVHLFFSFFLISMFVSLIEQFGRMISGSNNLTWILLASLISALAAMMRGRLIGLCYVFFTKKLRYLSLHQFFNRNPQEAIESILGRKKRDHDRDEES